MTDKYSTWDQVRQAAADKAASQWHGGGWNDKSVAEQAGMPNGDQYTEADPTRPGWNFAYEPDGHGGVKTNQYESKASWMDYLPAVLGTALTAGTLGPALFGGMGAGAGGLGLTTAGQSLASLGLGGAEAAGLGGASLGSLGAGAAGLAGGFAAPTAAELAAFGADAGGMGMTGAGGIGAASSVAGSGAGAVGYGAGALSAAPEWTSGYDLANGGAESAAPGATPSMPPGTPWSPGGPLSKLGGLAKDIISDPKKLSTAVGLIQSLSGGNKGSGNGMSPHGQYDGWTPYQQASANNFANAPRATQVNPYIGDLARAPITGGEHQWFTRPGAQPAAPSGALSPSKGQ